MQGPEIWPQPGQPVHSIKSFLGLPVFRGVYDLCGTVMGILLRDVDHAFLRKTGTDNVSGKITETCLVIGKDPVTHCTTHRFVFICVFFVIVARLVFWDDTPKRRDHAKKDT